MLILKNYGVGVGISIAGVNIGVILRGAPQSSN